MNNEGGTGRGRLLPSPRSFSVRDAMVVIFLVALLVRAGMGAGHRVAILLVGVGIFAAIVAGITVLIRSRAIRTEPMLWVVANAVERGVPIGPGIEACGALCGGGLQARAAAVVRLIEKGVPMPEAFSRVPGTFPKSSLVYLMMDWDGPEMGAALRSAVERQARWRPFQAMMRSRLSYLLWTLLAMQVVIAYMLLRIGPVLEAIFIDFGVRPPLFSEWTFRLGNHPVIVPAFLMLVLIQAVAIPVILVVASDPLAFRFAPIDWLLMKRHGATVMRLLSGEVTRKRPMPEALGRIIAAYPSRAVRRRLRRAKDRISRGQSWARAIGQVGLIRPGDVAVINAAERAGNLSWALGELAEATERRLGYRLMAWGQILYPVAVVALAVPVVVFALSYFLPLVYLIKAMAQ